MRFFVLLASVAAALAQQLTINTPQGVLACTNFRISWTGGSGPYILQIQPAGDTSAAALETYTNIAAPPYQWFVTLPANTRVFLRLHDFEGHVAESGTFTIQSAGGVTCSSSSVSGSGGTTSISSSGGVSSTPTSTTSTIPSSTPVSTSSSPTTTPSSSSSVSSSSTSSTSTTSTGGASAVQVAGGLVGLVGAVAVALA